MTLLRILEVFIVCALLGFLVIIVMTRVYKLSQIPKIEQRLDVQGLEEALGRDAERRESYLKLLKELKQ